MQKKKKKQPPRPACCDLRSPQPHLLCSLSIPYSAYTVGLLVMPQQARHTHTQSQPGATALTFLNLGCFTLE